MNKSALVHLKEIRLSVEAMRTLPEEHVAAVSVLCHALNEFNALARVYLASDTDLIGDEIIDRAIGTQLMTITRVLSAKLFEVVEFLEFGGRRPETEDQVLLAMGAKAIEEFEQYKSGEGYEIARALRHEASNHYPLKAARKNLASLHPKTVANFYIHEVNGNSFFPLGEAVMFDSRLNRKWKNIESEKERNECFLAWFEWCLETSRWLKDTHENFSQQLIFDPLGIRKYRKRVFWVPLHIVGEGSSPSTPVFRRRVHPK